MTAPLVQREDILQAAIDLATREGIGALSVRKVAAASGIGATTLRNYFPTQGDLAVAVVVELSNGGPVDGDIADASRPPLDRLAGVLDQLLIIDEPRRAGLELWMRLREAGRHDPDSSFALFLRSAYQGLETKISGWLVVLADEGELAPEIIEPATFTIMTFLDGLAMRQINGLIDDPDELRRRLRWMLARFLRKED